LTAFEWPTRVYWEDTDGGGVVYYANYLKFMERARTEWLRARGFSQLELARDLGVLFTVVDVQVSYRRAARLDDALTVTCSPIVDGRASLRFEQAIRRDAEVLTEGSVRVACVDANTFKPRRLPDAVVHGIKVQNMGVQETR
jgi:acyl-CoA thioester hydrolase